jgi:hypothetical protein
MTPEQFIDQYYKLPVEDPRMTVSLTLKIRKYEAAWKTEAITEATNVLDGVARKCCKLKRGNAELPATFTIPHDSRVDPSEAFYCAGIRRAFGSRGSPDEMRDALRLAILAGRPMPSGPKKYAEDHFGQDCNSFVANYLGLSPMIGIRAYAKGFSGSEYGAGRDLADCQKLLPLAPREDASAIAPGDVIVTYGSFDGRWRWRHIAMLDGIGLAAPVNRGSTTDWMANIKIVEWGTAGGSAQHISTRQRTLITDLLAWKPPAGEWATTHAELSKEMKGRKLVGFQSTDPSGKPAFRFFLDASSLDYVWHRGLHIANGYLGH